MLRSTRIRFSFARRDIAPATCVLCEYAFAGIGIDVRKLGGVLKRTQGWEMRGERGRSEEYKNRDVHFFISV